jgi:hypothetical protein
MAEEADAGVIIWDGESRGAFNMLVELLKRGKPVYVERCTTHSAVSEPMKSINLPFRLDVPLADQCSHGKLWTEDCIECEIVSLEDSLPRMEKTVKRDRARLERLYAMRATATSTGPQS